MEDSSYTVGDIAKLLTKIQRKKKKKDGTTDKPHLTELFTDACCCHNNEDFYGRYVHGPSIETETEHEALKTEEEEESSDEDDKVHENDGSSGSEDEGHSSDTADDQEQRPTKKKKGKTDGTPKDRRTVFVGNIPVSVDKKKLMKEFADYGTIDSVRMRSLAPSQPGVSKQLIGKTLDIHEKRDNYNAYIVYSSREAAERATQMNGEQLEGHHLRVDLTRNDKKNDSKRSIFLGGLPFDINEEDVRGAFEDYGDMESVRVVRDNATGLGKGFGFIVFKDPSSVALALKMNSQKLQGRRIRVKPVEKNPAKEKSGGPGGSDETSTDRWRRLDQKGRKRMRYKMKIKKRKAQDLATQGKPVEVKTGDGPKESKARDGPQTPHQNQGGLRTGSAKRNVKSGFGGAKDSKRQQHFSAPGNKGKQKFAGKKTKFD